MDYNAKRWQKKREKILRRDKYMCKESERFGKAREAETVHHILPVEFFPEYAYEDWNLISLKSAVHNTMHDRNTRALTKAGMDLAKRKIPPAIFRKIMENGERARGLFPTLK